MAFYNLIGHQSCSKVSWKTACQCFNFSAYGKFFVQVVIKTNLNISNELNFSDVFRKVIYIGSLAKFTCTPLGFVHSAHDQM